MFALHANNVGGIIRHGLHFCDSAPSACGRAKDYYLILIGRRAVESKANDLPLQYLVVNLLRVLETLLFVATNLACV